MSVYPTRRPHNHSSDVDYSTNEMCRIEVQMYLHIYLCLYFMNQAKCKTNMLGVEHCIRGGEDRMGK